MDRDERDEFIGKLKRWKYEGCSILVVGETLDLLRQTSELLLGADDTERYRLFVLTDAESATVSDRLFDASPSDLRSHTRVIEYGPIPRSVAAATTSTGPIPKTSVYGGLDDLSYELSEEMAKFDSLADGLPSAALRVSVDTLGPLLTEHDYDEVCRWLDDLGDATKSHRGIAHSLLPKPYHSEAVQQLQGRFEAVIEVKPSHDEGAKRKERWHVPNSGLTSPWRVMSGDTRGMM